MEEFKNTKYGKVYTDLILNARQSTLKVTYTEKHHIIPSSIGGSNNKENIVVLSFRQHYIAHLLLFKHYKKLEDKVAAYKMALAVNLMQHGSIHSTSPIKIKGGFSRHFQSVKETIRNNMTGSNNTMYGKVSANKGKKWEELYTAETIEKIVLLAKAKRKYTELYTWVNGDVIDVCTMHDLVTKYNLRRNHLIEILDGGSRKSTKGWSLQNTDTRNKYVREQSVVTYEFFRLGNKYPITATIDDMLNSYANLQYKGLRDIVNNYKSGDYSLKSYKGWMLEDTYNERIVLWSFHNTTMTWVDRITTNELELSIKQLSDLTGIEVGKLAEISQGTRTSSKYKIKDTYGNSRLL